MVDQDTTGTYKPERSPHDIDTVKLLTMKNESIWQLLESVYDPEVPVLSVVDLGVVREVERNGQSVKVTITPTYSGCPAMDRIGMDIKVALKGAGFAPQIHTVLSPAWTTDWLSEAGKAKLKAYGIAPPVGATTDKAVLMGEFNEVSCPRCDATQTKMISQFGSTACKALYQCQDCLEPFDYFKCH